MATQKRPLLHPYVERKKGICGGRPVIAAFSVWQILSSIWIMTYISISLQRSDVMATKRTIRKSFVTSS